MSKKLTIVVVMAFSANVSAEVVIDHSATVTAGTEYHSNIQYLEEDAESVYVYSLAPEYKIQALDGVNEWFGRVGLSIERSSNSFVSDDREDPFATIGWKRELEKGVFGLTANYFEESTRTTQLLETGLVSQDGTGVTRNVIADWTHALTNKLGLKVLASYEKSKFSGADELTEFDERELGVELDYKLNEKVTPFVGIKATDYRADDRIKYQNLLGGALVNFTPQLEVKAGVGVMHVSTTGEDEAVGFFEANYERQRSVFGVALSREAFTTAVNRVDVGDRLSLTYGYDLSEKSRLGAGLGLSQTNTGQKNQDFTGYYERDFTPAWLMRLSMALGNIKSTGENSTNNNTVGISFTYNSPKF